VLAADPVCSTWWRAPLFEHTTRSVTSWHCPVESTVNLRLTLSRFYADALYDAM
jgi:hypothetical protein